MPQTSANNNAYPVEPKVQPPTQRFLDTISKEDKLLLDRIMSEPQSCVPIEGFDKKSFERELFSESEEIKPARSSSAIPTLNAAQERLLFSRYNYARYRVCEVVRGCAGKRLPAKAGRELLEWGTLAQELRAQIIQFNLPLVLSMAKRSRLSGLDFNDLVSEGNFALMRSVDKFDVSRGFKFSTYACRAILKSFSRVAMKAGRYRGLFPVELNTDLERSDYVETRRMGVEEDCLDELKHILAANLADLTEVERTVIKERFAIGPVVDEQGTKTLEQVGRMIGVTKERVRQIQNKALDKIRHTLEQQWLAA